MSKSFRDQINKELRSSDLSSEKIRFFAWLCAVRALPFLGAKGDFFYWEKTKHGDRRQFHLLSILRALDAAAVTTADADAFDNAYNAYAAATTANTAADAYNLHGTVIAIDAAAATAYAAYAAYAVYAAADDDADDATAAADNAYDAASRYGVNLKSLLLQDLQKIKTWKYDFSPDTTIYREMWDNFHKALAGLGCKYWGNWYKKLFAKSFRLDEEDINEIKRRLNAPVEIREQGAKAVANYMTLMKEQGAKRLNEARVIILGDKGAGKTCLARRLINPEAKMTKEDESTEGVETTVWRIKGPKRAREDETNVHIWDFAGHVVTHAAHRCFLSERCLYIIVYDGRSEQRNRLDYWLDHVENYGGDSEVLVLINLRDTHKPEIPENTLKTKYPAIIDYKYFSIQNDRTKLENFRHEVESFIRNNPSWNKLELPSAYYIVKDKLLDCFQNNKANKHNELMTRRSFNEVALQIGIRRNMLEQLLKNLHALGICLWYENLASYNTLVLNPEWISHGIYRLINWAQEAKRYRISVSDYDAAFAEEAPRYPKDKFPFLFQLMCEYELAYAEKGTRAYVVPFLLKEDRPPVLPQFPITDSLMLEYTVESSLPPDVISRFIVLRNTEIANNGREAWRHGVVLTIGQATALVVEDDRKIAVSVKGRDKTNYISKLRETLNGIFNTYKTTKKPELTYRIIIYGPYEPPMLSQEAIIGHWKRNRDYYHAIAGVDISLQPTMMLYNIDIDKHIEINFKGVDHVGDKISSAVTGSNNQTVVAKNIKTGPMTILQNQPKATNFPDSLSDEDFQQLMRLLDAFIAFQAIGGSKPEEYQQLQSTVNEVKQLEKKKRGTGSAKLRAFLSDAANVTTILTPLVAFAVKHKDQLTLAVKSIFGIP